MAQIDHVLQSFLMHHPGGDTELVKKAYRFARERHKGQKRKSGEPYIVHPMSVSKIVADMGLCEPSICAALLHDVIEDTPTTQDDIRQLFGDDVALLVEGLTKLDNVRFTRREERQAESFRKMLIATVKDIRILLIKLADRLHNMSTLDALPAAKQERIAQETRDIYSPLAGRLGLSWLKADLDDLSFKYLEPEIYQPLFEKVRDTRKRRLVFINKAKKELEQLLVEKGLSHCTVSGRLKNLFSIHLKMVNKDLDYEKIYDAIAFRVITRTVEECYAILGYVHACWVPIPGHIKDYIAMPKANHYQSLHTTVVGDGGDRMEIQIRTQAMHEVNEYGIAAHWAYKEGRDQDSALDVYAWLREILENQRELNDSREFFDSVKVDLMSDQVFVFTPAGDIKMLSRGATPLDFAYAVHTEVGNHCHRVRVNGVLVSFDYELNNGDDVEVFTSKDQRPTAGWLDLARTSRAQNKIKAYLRAEQREQSLLAGKELLAKALRRNGLSYSKVVKAGILDKAAQRYKLVDGNDLIAAVGVGKLDESAVVMDMLPEEEQAKVRSQIKETAFEKLLRSVKWQDNGIVIDGVDNLMVQFAKCCNPLHGETIVGYISRGRGIVVHRRGCAQASTLDKERKIKVQWSGSTACKRPVRLQVITGDKPGILANMTNSFQSKKINLSSLQSNTTGPDGAVTTFVFSVDNVAQLNDIIKTLRQTKGVYQVQRISG